MSRRARIVPGHSMITSGRNPARFADDGNPGHCGELAGRAQCECGAQSVPGLTIHQARSWHQEHRQQVRGLHQDTPDPGALLTPRERELTDAMARGLTRKQAAAALDLSDKAAAERLKLALRRTGYPDVTELLTAVAAQTPPHRPTEDDTPTNPHPTDPKPHPQ